MPPPSRERACARLSLITVSSATGVSGLCRQRAAPSSSAMRRKSGAGESSNMRHEDIDDHQVEGCLVERRESAGAPSETATLNPFAPEPCPYREANVRVTVDNQNAAHHDLLAIAGRLRVIGCTAIFAAPISSRFLCPPQAVMSVCPERCISISRRSVDRVGNHPPRPIISWKRMSMKALPLRDRYSDAGCHGRARRNFHAR